MKRTFVLACATLVVSAVTFGCGQKSEVKQTEKVTGPGGTTTTTVDKKVESSGHNPPANSAGESVPK